MRAPRVLRRALGRARYRTGQVTRGFQTALAPHEVARARELLGDDELALFAAMHPRDRRHSFDVLRWLDVTSGSQPPSRNLQRAALLHDVGKGPITLGDRVAFVLLGAISPRLVDAIAGREGARWRRGLWALRHHAAIGAACLRARGTEVRVVELVAAHANPTPGADLELGRLMEADAAS